MPQDAFDGNFVALVREMEAAARAVDAFPDDREWTMDEMTTMDDVRTAALRLAERVEALISTFRGG